MPNHVHLILNPSTPDGLARAVGEAHRRYAGFINAWGRWRGHLFEGRFAPVVMDELHLLAAVRYVSLNPVRARLVRAAEDWPWSSVRAHLAGKDDGLVEVAPVLGRIPDFRELIAGSDAAESRYAPALQALQALRAAETTGRALAAPALVADLERLLGRRIARRAPGRKARQPVEPQPQLL